MASCNSPADGFANQPVNARQKRGKSFSGTCRRANQRGPVFKNVGPALLLRFCRRSKFFQEPRADERVRPAQYPGLDIIQNGRIFQCLTLEKLPTNDFYSRY